MAIPAATVWEFRSSATANMLNGGGFNSARGGVDYSQQDTAQLTNTDLTCTAGSTTVTSAGGGFTSDMVGNIIHLTALTGTGALVGWYEIVTFTDANNVVLDRTPTNGVNNITAGTFYVGGALTMSGSLNDSFWEQIVAGNQVWIKSGTYTLGSVVNVSTTAGTALLPIKIYGYNATRGDNPTPFGASATAPVIAMGANGMTVPAYTDWRYLSFSSTSATGFQFSSNSAASLVIYCKFTNTSTTADRVAVGLGTSATAHTQFLFSEAVSQNGYAASFSTGRGSRMYGVYIHDSKYGTFLNPGASPISIENSLFKHFSSQAVQVTSTINTGLRITNCTLYGAKNTPVGTGVDMANGFHVFKPINTIFYGFATAINIATANQLVNMGWNNNFYNNTTDATNYTLSSTDLTLDPQFTDDTELTGSTATTSGSVLTQTGADFSGVTDNIDYVRVVSGTGVTTGIYLITSHTGTTLTVNNALGTSSAGDVVWVLQTGSNVNIGTNLKAQGVPAAFPGSESTSYLDIGAAQREEQSSGGGGTRAYVG